MVPFLSNCCHAWPSYLLLKMESKIWIFPIWGNHCKTNYRVPCWGKQQQLKPYVFSSVLVLYKPTLLFVFSHQPILIQSASFHAEITRLSLQKWGGVRKNWASLVSFAPAQATCTNHPIVVPVPIARFHVVWETGARRILADSPDELLNSLLA